MEANLSLSKILIYCFAKTEETIYGGVCFYKYRSNLGYSSGVGWADVGSPTNTPTIHVGLHKKRLAQPTLLLCLIGGISSPIMALDAELGEESISSTYVIRLTALVSPHAMCFN